MNNLIPEEEIYHFLINNNNLFYPPLNKRVDLIKYSLKLANRANHFFIREKTNNILQAFSAIYIDNVSQLAYISFFCVDRNYQNRGLGKKLMNQLLEYLNNSNIVEVSLEVDISNSGAINFYENFQFYFSQKKQNSLIMTKILKNES